MNTFVFVVALLVAASVTAQNDKINNLPGLPKINFNQYAGYVEVAPGRFLFYWFVGTILTHCISYL
jgi:hypothetical protein